MTKAVVAIMVAAAIVIVATGVSEVTAMAKTASQNSKWTAHPFLYARPAAGSGPGALAPTQVIGAYNLASTTNGTGTTIAIVDAYDDPTIVSDLATFNNEFQLPISNFVVHKMAVTIDLNASWALEISLDVEWAHAIAPQAKILLVEANSSTLADLLDAVSYATSYPGVTAVSMSWGGSEFFDEHTYDSYFTKPGVVFFASSGDNGAGVEWPSGSPNVVSVGGTTLNLNPNGTVKSETAWSGSGGGVSAYERQPDYQSNYGLAYANRATPDVSYDADPNTGLSVYDTTPYHGTTGWWDVGGTSAGAPQWAAIQALGNTTGNSNFYPDAEQSASKYFRDITSGSNGYPAGPGYDLVTGLGSPVTTNFTPPSTAPSAPRNLMAAGHNGYVTLTWSDPSSDGGSNITGYKIYRGTTSGGETLLRTLSNVLTFTNTGLTNGRIYYYTVSAVNSAGEGAISNEASAIPATVPTAPALTSAAPSNSQVVLTWTTPSSNGGASITGYKVYQGTISGGEALLATLGNVLTYTSAGLTNGQIYYYKVSAVNSVGEGPQSNEVSAIPVTVPGVPQSFSAVSANAQVILTWSAPASNGGSAITGYKVYRSTAESGTYTLVASPTVTNYTDTGLTNGQTYWYEIGAVNAVGEGARTQPISASPATLPGVPRGFTVTPGNAQVTLNWTSPSFNGGRAITGYNIYASSQNSTTGSEVLFVGNVLSYTDGSLANGQTYYYWVSAVNSVGEGPKSDEGAAIPYTIPDSPTGFTAIAGDGQVTLNWTAPAFDGGRAIDYYIVYQDGYALLDHAIGLTDVITGLTNGQSPSFAVAAHNLAGNGTLSIAVSSTPYTVPDAPTGLQAIAGNDQVSLNWTVPVFDGGRAIDYYLIYEDGVALPDHVSDVTEIITGLINGQNYHFSVAAHNTGGIGNESGGVSSIPFTFPNAATGLTAIAGDGKAALNWSIPSSDGGREVDYYVVYQDGVALPNHPTGSTDVITGLTNGQSYSFTVAAHNIAGLGLQSIAVSAIPFTIPDAPIGLVATVGNAQVTLNWTAPAFDGGRAIDYYVIHEDGIALPGLRTGVMTVISGLDNGRNYSFAVAAYNLAGNGTLSIAVSSTPYTVPDAPTGLQAIAGDDQVTLSWTAPTDDGGRAIDYYVVYQNGAAFLDHVVGLTTVIASLINGQSYSFMVAAHNLAGIGTQSLAASGTPVTVPNAPTWLMAISGNAQVTLNWTAPASDGGSPVTDYKIYRSTTPDGNYSLVATPTVLAYTDTGLTNGQTYYYKVYACNIVGDGPMTAVVNTTPQAPSSTDTMTFYIGIGAVVIVAAIGAAVLVMRRRK